MLKGAEVLGVTPTSRKDPELVNKHEDWWEEYKIDLSQLQSMQDWSDFRVKWCAWMNPETLETAMTPHKLRSWMRQVKEFHHDRVLPRDNGVRQLLGPIIFTIIEACRRCSVRKGEMIPTWAATFRVLADLEYLLVNNAGRVVVNAAKLEPGANEKIITPESLGKEYRAFRRLLDSTKDVDPGSIMKV